MAAVAARSAAAEVQRENEVREVQSTRRIIKRRRKVARWKSPKFLLGMLCAGLVCGFCFVNTYANLAKTGYSRDELTNIYNQEKLENEQLKVQWNLLSSPRNVTAAAEKAGMIYAKDYDYLGKEKKTVASASESAIKD